MNDTSISAELYRLVKERAQGICEYCLIHKDDTLLGCVAVPIVSVQEGGQIVVDNLAYMCALCNQAKGSESGATDLDTWEFTLFFNPRLDKWRDHFVFHDNHVAPFSAIGRVSFDTISSFKRMAEREELVTAGRYPPLQALPLMIDL